MISKILALKIILPKTWIKLRNLPLLGVASSNASIGNYHGLKKIHMPLTFQQDKGISFPHMKRLMTRNFKIEILSNLRF